MGGIMKNIAYKVSKDNPNLPDGFITDHFETDKDSEEGYLIAPLGLFNKLLENNIELYRNFEKAKGIITADSNAPAVTPRPAEEAQTVAAAAPQSVAEAAAAQAANANVANNAQLFAEFLAWKQSQGQ